MKKPKQNTMATLISGVVKSLRLSKTDCRALALKSTFVNARLLISAMGKQFHISSDHFYETSYSGTLLVSTSDKPMLGLAEVLEELSEYEHLFDLNDVSVHTFGNEVELVNDSGIHKDFMHYVAIDLNVYTAPITKYTYVVYENEGVDADTYNIGIFVSGGSSERTLIPCEIIFGKTLDLNLTDLGNFINLFSQVAGSFKDRAVDIVKLRDLIQVEKVYCLE